MPKKKNHGLPKRAPSQRKSGESAPPPPSIEEDIDGATKEWRRIFARFLREAALSLNSPYPFFVQTNGWKGLSLLMLLMPLEFSAVLLGCRLTRVERKADGSVHRVTLDERIVNNFFRNYGLRTLDGRGGLAEITNGSVYEDTLEMPKRGATIPKSRGQDRKFWMIRLGDVPPGERGPKASTEMNKRTDPPETNLRLALAQRRLRLHLESSDLMKDIFSDPATLADCKAIRDWVVAPPQFKAPKETTSPNPRAAKKTRIGSPAKGGSDPQPTTPADGNGRQHTPAAGSRDKSAVTPEDDGWSATHADGPGDVDSPPPVRRSVGDELQLSPEGQQYLVEQFPTLAKMTPESLGTGTRTERSDLMVNSND